MSRYIKSIAVVLLIATAIGLAGVQAAGYSDIGQLDGTRIGVQTGTADGEIVEAQFPDATVTYYGSDLSGRTVSKITGAQMTLADLSNAKIGVSTGTNYPEIVFRRHMIQASPC